MAKSAFHDRLWSYIQVGDLFDCWNWLGTTNSGGYGMIRLSAPSTDRVLAHRAVYEETHQVVLKESDVVRHSCDHPSCCNPAHLVSGTKRDNTEDAVSRGRHSRSGGKHKGCITMEDIPEGMPNKTSGPAKLSPRDVVEIRDLYRTGVGSMRRIAEMYGINVSTVSYCVRGKTWSV